MQGKIKLGGAGLTVNNQAEKGNALKKPVVGYVHGTFPVGKNEDAKTRLSHSPIKARGK